MGTDKSLAQTGDDKKLVKEEQRWIQVLIELAKPKTICPSATMMVAQGLSQLAFELDTDYGAIPLTPSQDLVDSPESRGMNFVVVRGKIHKKNIKDLEAQPNIVKVWQDRAGITSAGNISNFIQGDSIAADASPNSLQLLQCPIPPCDCDWGTPKGTIIDVANSLGVDEIHADGIRGQNIVVGIIGGGITAVGRPINPLDTNNLNWPGKLIPNVVDGPTADWGTTGILWRWDGNMCATDILGMAPEARLYDLRISDNTLSYVLANYQWAIERHRVDGTPHIIANSWQWNYPDDDYATNPEHPITRKIVEAINEGIIVLFTAGVCGGACGPDDRCGDNVGSGKSIWGANGHDRVITVAAVNKSLEYVGYSSVGPAALSDRKPDIASITHFTGFFDSNTRIFKCDGGGSAAVSIAAGVTALLKQVSPSLTQERAKDVLMATAFDLGPQGWDKFLGAGIIQAKWAYNTFVISLRVLLVVNGFSFPVGLRSVAQAIGLSPPISIREFVHKLRSPP